MLKNQERLKKSFLGELEKHLIFLGYEGYELETRDNLGYEYYRLALKTEPVVIYFDCYDFTKTTISFLHFTLQGIMTATLFKIFKKNKKSIENTKVTHIKEKFNREQLELKKEKIRQLIEVDKTIKITKIAEELGITRQSLYKNIELKNFIDRLKKQ